jgi:ankyrin repeat protein
MLDGGYDSRWAGVTGRSTLHTFAAHAPASAMEMLLHRGIALDARDANGRSVLATAVRAGNRPVVELLRSRGVEDDSTLMDRLIGLCVAGDAVAAQQLVLDRPDVMALVTRADVEELVLAAARGNIDQVRLMLACGFAADAAGESGATALHQAAWRGHVAIVELMLARGASPVARDALYGETAVDWARHGAAHTQGAQDPCLESARLIEGATAG